MSSLHQAAIDGNCDEFRQLLAADGTNDVNSLDSAERNIMMCAVAGNHWKNLHVPETSYMTEDRLSLIRLLLQTSNINLWTLNGPQKAFNGVTPLGMASWLKMLSVVVMMLEESAGSISVDGPDCHGATALMYATRDGSLDVVKVLLRHGARPDFRDLHHRSPIQYALTAATSHPDVLYLCESALRWHRLRECQSAKIRLSPQYEYQSEYSKLSFPTLEAIRLPVFTEATTSRVTDTLVQSVISSNTTFLQSLLFSSSLPSTSSGIPLPALPVLVNRPDSKGWSPVHYCASIPSPSINILDMLYCAGAEVSLFTSTEHYTPLHILGRYARYATPASSAATLYQFTTHLVHDLRAPLSAQDMDDETCIHVAAEHGNCIEVLIAFLDCDFSGSVREIRNARGLTALEVAKPEFRVAFGSDAERFRSTSAMSSNTIRRASDSSSSLVSLTDDTGLSAPEDMFPSDFDISSASRQLIANLRFITPSIPNPTPAHLDHLENLLHDSFDLSRVVLAYFLTRTQDLTRQIKDLRAKSERAASFVDHVCHLANEQLVLRNLQPIHPRKLYRGSEDSQATAVSLIEASASKTSLNSRSSTPATMASFPRPRKRSGALTQWFDNLRITVSDQTKDSAPSKETTLRGWFKQKLVAEKTTVVELSVETPPAVESAQTVSTPPKSIDSVEYALRTARFVLSAASQDLRALEDCIDSAQEVLDRTNYSISRVDRLTKRALKKRAVTIKQLRQNPERQVHHQSSSSSLFSISSTASSIASFAETLTENDDPETRAIRRLTLRKIEAGTHGAMQEIDRIQSWLIVVKDVARGVKKRAYL